LDASHFAFLQGISFEKALVNVRENPGSFFRFHIIENSDGVAVWSGLRCCHRWGRAKPSVKQNQER